MQQNDGRPGGTGLWGKMKGTKYVKPDSATIKGGHDNSPLTPEGCKHQGKKGITG